MCSSDLPPTLSLPVLESGPLRRERAEPSVSGTDWIKPPLKEFDVPRLDTPAPKRPVNRIDLADTTDPEVHDTEEQAFNEAVFGNSDLDLGEESTIPDLSAEAPRAGRTASPEPARRTPSEPAWRASPETVRPAVAEAARAIAPEPAPHASPELVRGPSSEAARRTASDTARAASPDAARRAAPEAEWNVRSDASPAAPEATRAPPYDAVRPTAPDAWPVQASAPSDGPADREAPDAAESEEPPVPRFTAADVAPIAEPIVDWPPDDQRRVVALRLVAPPPDRLPGRALRLALASEGFVLGKFQIFHKPDATGRAVLSAANLSKPGTFDLGTMDVQRFGGLSLFTVLPGPKPPLKAFDDLLATARNLNERLQGALQDERGGPLTPTRIASLRESLSSMEAAS